MNFCIVYESFFGNTKRIAEAVGQALSESGETKLVPVSEMKIDDIRNLDYLIVGSPTRAFRPTQGVLTFLKRIPVRGLEGVKVAAFDTRIAPDDVNSRILKGLVRLFGYAAEPIADKLQKKSGNLIMPPEGFLVLESEGPLKEGELKRAADWGKKIREK